LIVTGEVTPTAISAWGRLTGPGPFLWGSKGLLSGHSKAQPVPVPPSGSDAVGAAVNSQGDVAGFALSSSDGRAFLTRRGGNPVDIHALLSPTTDSYAVDVNENGGVVGYMAGVGFPEPTFSYPHHPLPAGAGGPSLCSSTGVPLEAE
jgi:hypothetical protein